MVRTPLDRFGFGFLGAGRPRPGPSAAGPACRGRPAWPGRARPASPPGAAGFGAPAAGAGTPGFGAAGGARRGRPGHGRAGLRGGGRRRGAGGGRLGHGHARLRRAGGRRGRPAWPRARPAWGRRPGTSAGSGSSGPGSPWSFAGFEGRGSGRLQGLPRPIRSLVVVLVLVLLVVVFLVFEHAALGGGDLGRQFGRLRSTAASTSSFSHEAVLPEAGTGSRRAGTCRACARSGCSSRCGRPCSRGSGSGWRGVTTIIS